jgi:DNA repair exonuclease SbcCD ATPase subunit
MTKKIVAEKKPLDFHIHDVGGIYDFQLQLKQGVNVLGGRNGAGKTSALRAVSRAMGAEIPIEVRDGAETGTIKGAGVTLKIRKVAKTSGIAEAEIADTGRLADLIDGGGFADPDARNRARIRALLWFVQLPINEETIAVLAGDPVVAAAALHECRENLISDLLEAAEKTRRTAHALAKTEEDGANEAGARARVHDLHAEEALRKIGGKDRIVEVPFPEADAQHGDLLRKLEVSRIQAKARIELETRQAEIRATLGERPDPARYDEDIELRGRAIASNEQSIRDLEADIRKLEAQIAERRAKLAGIGEDLRHLRSQREQAVEAARAWDQRAELLNRPVTGPVPDDVAKLERAVERAADVVTRARESEEYTRNRRAAAEAAQIAKDRAERGEILRALATTVQERLGLLLQNTDAAGLTVFEGRLHVIEGNQLHDFETRRSDGQRISIALRIAAGKYEGKVVPLDGRFWTQLDSSARQHFAAEAARLGLYTLTEEPTDDELHVTHFAGAEVPEPVGVGGGA